MSEEDSACPLVVDLDGTVLRSDSLPGNGRAFLKTFPLCCWKLLVWASARKTFVVNASRRVKRQARA
jgi:hypothetical protein